MFTYINHLQVSSLENFETTFFSISFFNIKLTFLLLIVLSRNFQILSLYLFSCNNFVKTIVKVEFTFWLWLWLGREAACLRSTDFSPCMQFQTWEVYLIKHWDFSIEGTKAIFCSGMQTGGYTESLPCNFSLLKGSITLFSFCKIPCRTMLLKVSWSL